jgi:hypothetical protein
VSGTDSTVPIRHESKDIDLGLPKIIVSVAMAQSNPTKEVPGSSDPPGGRSASPDPSRVGLASSDPLETTPPRLTPRGRIHSQEWRKDPKRGPCRLDRHEHTPPNTKRKAGMLPHGLQP